MNSEKKIYGEFIKEISRSFEISYLEQKYVKEIFKNSLSSKECIYILDFSKNEITYHKGFKSLLGFEQKDLSIDFLSDNVHQDDLQTLNKVRKATLTFCLKNPKNSSNYLLSITYRIKKSDNTYLDILSQSQMFDTNSDGKLTSILIKLTDISFMNNSKVVNWDFEGNGLDKKAFRSKIYKEYQDVFTERELEVILKILEGLTNKLIGEKLNISEHTVATHRKHIFKKSGCHNTNELILFCSKNDIT